MRCRGRFQEALPEKLPLERGQLDQARGLRMPDPLIPPSKALSVAVLLLLVSVEALDKVTSNTSCVLQTNMTDCQEQSVNGSETELNVTATMGNGSILDAKCSLPNECEVRVINKNSTAAFREGMDYTTTENEGPKETRMSPTTGEADASTSWQQSTFEITGQILAHADNTTATLVAITARDPQIVTASSLFDDVLDLPNEEIGTNNSLNKSVAQDPNGRSQGLVSKEMYSRVFEISNIGIISATTVSVPVNLINLLVYVQPCMRSASSTYLVVMSATELLYGVLVSSVGYMGLLQGTPVVYSYEYLTYTHFAGNYLSIVIQREIFCLKAFVSAERFVAVAFPIRAMQTRLVRNPAAICLISLVVLAAVHFHVAAKYDIVRDETTNATSYKLKLSDFAQKSQVFYSVVATLTRAIFAYPPVLATLALTLGTVFSLRRHRNATAHLARGTKRGSVTQMTVTIVVSSLVSAILALPLLLQSEAGTHHPLYGFNKQEHFLFLMLNVLSIWLAGLSNNANFVVYLLVSSRYRATLRRILGFHKCHRG